MAYPNLQPNHEGRAIGTSSPPKSDPNTITARLSDMIYGLNNVHHLSQQISAKLWGPAPEPISSVNQTPDPAVNVLLDILQGRILELQQNMEYINKAL